MKYIALIDCNNFFASCERVFRPSLSDKPVAVLSNNDGCIVARTNEIKKLGVPMAAPYFKWKEVMAKAGAEVFSANFALYSDLSRRITNILEEEAPEIEVYSIDESFVGLDMSNEMAQTWARRIRAKVLQDIGVPVSVGIAPTKTLAKAGSEYAKKHQESGGVTMIESADSASYREVLGWLEVGDVWGVGFRMAPKLQRGGIYTALALSKVTIPWARQQMTIRGEKLIRELRGERCYSLNETDHSEQKSMLVSRSFAEPVRNLSELEVAVASFATTLAHKLRTHKQLAKSVWVFASSSRFKGRPVHIRKSFSFAVPTSDSSRLCIGAVDALKEVFQLGVSYKRAGVYIGDLTDLTGRQMSMFSDLTAEKLDKEIRRGEAIEELTNRWGSDVIKPSLALRKPSPDKEKWRSAANLRSPEYTTKWDEIAHVQVKAKA